VYILFGVRSETLDIPRSAASGDACPLTDSDSHICLVTDREIISTNTVSIIILKKKFGMYYKRYHANILLFDTKI
jgi:hypothetical protein